MATASHLVGGAASGHGEPCTWMEPTLHIWKRQEGSTRGGSARSQGERWEPSRPRLDPGVGGAVPASWTTRTCSSCPPVPLPGSALAYLWVTQGIGHVLLL